MQNLKSEPMDLTYPDVIDMIDQVELIIEMLDINET